MQYLFLKERKETIYKIALVDDNHRSVTLRKKQKQDYQDSKQCDTREKLLWVEVSAIYKENVIQRMSMKRKFENYFKDKTCQKDRTWQVQKGEKCALG